jgi:hypothetical protein
MVLSEKKPAKGSKLSQKNTDAPKKGKLAVKDNPAPSKGKGRLSAVKEHSTNLQVEWPSLADIVEDMQGEASLNVVKGSRFRN